MINLDLMFTIKIIFIAVFAFLVITAWDELIDRILLDLFGLDRNSIWSWVIIASISTGFLILLLLLFHIEAHDVLGISETVDVILTKKIEQLKDGELIHVNV